MVIALAGRRVDPPRADTAHFPPANVPGVEKRINDWFGQHEIHTLVCSAACGADLLALGVAGKLNIRRYIVLPFSPEQFRTASVVDRGGDWGTRFDAILDVVQSQGNLCVLNYTPEDERAYFETNQVILELATSLGGQLDESVGVVVVWDGASRGDDDVTAAFQEEACKRGLAVEEILTL